MTAFEKLLQDLAEQAARPDGNGLDWRGWYWKGRALSIPTDAVLPLAMTTGEALYFATSLAETLVGPADIEVSARRRVGALREGLLSRLYEEIMTRNHLGRRVS